MTQIWYDWGAGGVGMGSDYSKDRNLSFVSIYLSLLVFMLFNLYVFSCQIWWKTKHRNLLGQWSIYRQEPFLCLHLIFCLHFAHFLFTFVKFYTFIYKTQICYSQGAGWSIYRHKPFLCLHLTFCLHFVYILFTFVKFCTFNFKAQICYRWSISRQEPFLCFHLTFCGHDPPILLCAHS